jgi:hypothetical protein
VQYVTGKKVKYLGACAKKWLMRMLSRPTAACELLPQRSQGVLPVLVH